MEQGGSKAQWFTNARNALESPELSNVRAYVYFHAPDHQYPSDWRVTSSVTAASAYRAWSEDPFTHPGGTVQPRPLVAGAFVWPQPASKSTSIGFTLRDGASVAVEIRDANGITVLRHVATLAYNTGGYYQVKWDVKDDARRRMTAGTYRAVVRATTATETAESSQTFQVK